MAMEGWLAVRREEAKEKKEEAGLIGYWVYIVKSFT